MPHVPHPRRRLLLGVVALLGFGTLAASSALADIYDDAVAHPGRSADDLKRDPIDRPADMLRLAGLKPGMQVADFMAADGYYSELASYIVGPKGHVLLLNNATWDYWSGNHWKERIAGRLPNVEHRTIDAEHVDVADHSQDAVLLIDHSAKPGTGTADATSLHRIDEAYTRAEFEKHGLRLVSSSDLLRRADDPRDAISYKGPMVGKTDRFVLVFRRNK